MVARAAEYGADVIMVDSPLPGSGQVFDWRWPRRPDGLRLMLAGGLTADNVAEAIAQVHPWGVDVATGVEASPGRRTRASCGRSSPRPKRRADRDPSRIDGDDDSPDPYDWRLDRVD